MSSSFSFSEPASYGLATPKSVIRQGEMKKKGQRHKAWKKRYFTLDSEGSLTYGKDQYETYGIIKLNEVSGISKRDYSQRPNCFYIQTSSRCYFMQANSAAELNEWVETVLRCTVLTIGMNLSSTQTIKLRRVFDKFDIDDKAPGRLSYDIVAYALTSLGKVVRPEHLDLVVTSFDRTASGDVDLLEFVCGIWMLFKGYKTYSFQVARVETDKRIAQLEGEVESLRAMTM